MISSLAGTLSAIHAFQTKKSVSANNIANVNTLGFKKSRTDIVQGKNGGVEAKVTPVKEGGTPVETVQNGQKIETESSNVDLAEEIVEGLTADKGYTANLKMVQTKDEMLGTLLDTFS